jgi:hypothetical protein
MTPADFKLLAGIDVSAADTMRTRSPIPGSVAALPERISAVPGGFDTLSTTAPLDNPYLRELQADEAIARAVTTPADSPRAPTTPVHLDAPQILSTQPSSLAEQLKNRDDAKYFKQLKRF